MSPSRASWVFGKTMQAGRKIDFSTLDLGVGRHWQTFDTRN